VIAVVLGVLFLVSCDRQPEPQALRKVQLVIKGGVFHRETKP
jgi:hypothetical protein